MVEIGGADELQLSPPTFLFEMTTFAPDQRSGVYDVMPDGERFLLAESSDDQDEIHVVLNWFTELERLVPTGR